VTKYKTKTWNVSAWAAVRRGTGSERYQDSSRRDEEGGKENPQTTKINKIQNIRQHFRVFNEASDIIGKDRSDRTCEYMNG